MSTGTPFLIVKSSFSRLPTIYYVSVESRHLTGEYSSSILYMDAVTGQTIWRWRCSMIAMFEADVGGSSQARCSTEPTEKKVMVRECHNQEQDDTCLEKTMFSSDSVHALDIVCLICNLRDGQRVPR